MKNQNQFHGKKDTERSFFISCLISQAVWAVSGIVFLLILCAVASSMADPDSVIVPLSLCALYLSSMIGGIAAVRLSKDGIMSGLVSGILTAIIVFAVSSLPFSGGNFKTTESLIYGALIIPVSCIGALIGKKKSKRKNKRKHR